MLEITGRAGILVIASHDPNTLLQHCNLGMRLEKGRIVDFAPSRESSTGQRTPQQNKEFNKPRRSSKTLGRKMMMMMTESVQTKEPQYELPLRSWLASSSNIR